MKLPTTTEVLFSLKCIAAALLALYVALAFALPRPFWAMMTCYIIANPFSGPVRSKAVFRVIGTVLGSIATIILVPQLANSPELLSLALACWVGLCLFISLLDRTPRAYIFMLAGYTAALIGFPSVNDPSGIFDIALSRVEEISIGIVCASLVHGIVLPQSWGPVMLSRVTRVMYDTQKILADVFASSNPAQLQKDKGLLASDITELRTLAIHLPFDTSHLRWTSDAIYSMHEKLALLLPLLSGISDRLRQLRLLLKQRDETQVSIAWSDILTRVTTWTRLTTSSNQTQQEQQDIRLDLEQDINLLTPTIHEASNWSDFIQLNLANRLKETLRVMDDVLALHRTISASVNGTFPEKISEATPQKISNKTPWHHDYRLAFMSAIAAIVAILCCCLFWIATAWPSGSVAAMMAAVFCCFFAVQDDPVPSIKTFLYFTLASVPISALYVLWILPATHSFESMAIVVFPMLFILGIYLARPQHGLKSIAMLLGVLGSFALQESGAVDIGVFMNATIAQTLGVIVALVMTAVLRSVNTAWRTERLLAAGHRDLVQLCSGISTLKMQEIASKMLDRVAQLAPRLSVLNTASTNVDMHAVDALLDVRLGLNVVQLRQLQSKKQLVEVDLAPLLQCLSKHFSNSTAQKIKNETQLLANIDMFIYKLSASTTLYEKTTTSNHSASSAVLALTAIIALRRDLFPDATAYAAIINPVLQINAQLQTITPNDR